MIIKYYEAFQIKYKSRLNNITNSAVKGPVEGQANQANGGPKYKIHSVLLTNVGQ